MIPFLSKSGIIYNTMRKERLKEVIKEFQEWNLPNVVPRELNVPLSSRKIVSIVGPRRSGKTFYLYGLIKKLLSSGVPREEIVFVNFDDPRLLPCDSMCLEELLQAYRELYPERIEKTSYLFLDEIQNVKGWEVGVRRLYDTGRFKIYLTGSSSKLLSREIASNLRGRGVSFELLPFSLREILRAREVKVDKNIAYSTQRAYVKKLVEEYLELGGFPEVVLETDPAMKLRILREYMETMFIKDLVERYNIRNSMLLRELVKFLLTNTAKRFSANSFYKWIKTSHPVTKRTLLNYIHHLEDSGLFFFVRKFAFSLKEQAQAVRKTYVVDVGLRASYGFKFSKDKGTSLENAVFLEFYRRKTLNPLLEIYYWRDYRGREVDFAVKEGQEVKSLVQVSLDLNNPKTKQREIAALLAGSEALNCSQLQIVTLEEERTEEVGGKTIKITPLWKWLLSLSDAPA